MPAPKTSSKRKCMYTVWLAAYPVFKEGWHRAQTPNKTKRFWDLVAQACGFATGDTARNSK